MLLIFVMGCFSNSKTKVSNCPIYVPDKKKYPNMEDQLVTDLEDSIINREFETSVRDHHYHIKDRLNNWENKYSPDYSNLVVKAFNNDYVLIYCPRSGIIEGYKLFPDRTHDLYLIQRTDGKNVKSMAIDRGLVGAMILDKSVFLKFFDPDEIRKCDF